MITPPLHNTLEAGELLNMITLTKMPLALVFLEPSLSDLYSISAFIEHLLCSRYPLQTRELGLWATFYEPETKTQGGEWFAWSHIASQRHNLGRKLVPYFKVFEARAALALSVVFTSPKLGYCAHRIFTTFPRWRNFLNCRNYNERINSLLIHC